jgi:hypothetical protein
MKKRKMTDCQLIKVETSYQLIKVDEVIIELSQYCAEYNERSKEY